MDDDDYEVPSEEEPGHALDKPSPVLQAIYNNDTSSLLQLKDTVMGTLVDPDGTPERERYWNLVDTALPRYRQAEACAWLLLEWGRADPLAQQALTDKNVRFLYDGAAWNEALVATLLEMQAPLPKDPPALESLLVTCLKARRTESARLMIDAGAARPLVGTPHEVPLINQAAWCWDIGLLRRLQEEGFTRFAEVDPRNGMNALHWAACHPCSDPVCDLQRLDDVVRFLLAQGASPSLSDNKGLTPAATAVSVVLEPVREQRRAQVMLRLLDAGSPLEGTVEVAAKAWHRVAIDALASRGVSVANELANRTTALHLAAASVPLVPGGADPPSERFGEFVQALLAHGADLNARDAQGETPMMRILDRQRFSWLDWKGRIALLAAQGGDLDATNAQGETVKDLLQKLVKEGNVTKSVAGEATALWYAQSARSALSGMLAKARGAAPG